MKRRRLSRNTRLELFAAMQNLARIAARDHITAEARTDLNRARERIAAALSHLSTDEGDDRS